MNRKDIIINGVDFTLTELSSYGSGFGIRKWREKYDTNHFIIKTVHTKFNKSLFSFPHTPIVISELYNVGKFSQRKNLRVLDMPIKFPGSSDYRVPKELNHLDEAISKIISFEHLINPNISEYFAYLTVDQGRIPSNSFQRKPGCHVDGFQGARIKRKRPINRSYIIYDEVPTVFYPQEFRTDHLNEETDNFFLSFDEQADERMAITFDPYKILLMNAYTVHRADRVNYEIDRTFFRLSFDTLVFDRYGNTHNPMFDYKWDMVTRDTQKHLVHKRLPYHPDAF
jgi:hypothetical protein